MTSDLADLSPFQRELVELWLPGVRVVADHSWRLVGRLVLELLTEDGARFIAKAGDEDDHHMLRELDAYERWVPALASIGRAPRILRGHRDARLLVTEYLPGELLEGTAGESDPEAYRQAGELLARFHQQTTQLDDGTFESRQRDDTLRWLGEDHRIPDASVAAIKGFVATWTTPPSALVPTHGDWHPRNWITDKGIVHVIDFGRAALRPAHTDLVRLAAQQFLGDPMLELAFLDGYGRDPREPAAWFRSRVREAVGTAAWAHRVGDKPFEEQGLAMVSAVVDELGWTR